ncbi:hypothetical protein BH11PAT2_BH11PAT2_00470 [soil metagenome]
MTTSYRTGNRHSMQFKMRKFVRRTRTRVLTALIEILETNTQLAG